ncbi:MAG: hypothetical protein AAGI38_19235 [Bacteroidota bacterium]
MAVALTFLASLLLYGTSRYFPEELSWVHKPLTKYDSLAVLMGTALLFLSLWFFAQEYRMLTACVIWAVVVATVLSSLVISVKISPKSLFIWSGFAVVIAIVDIFM